MIISENRFAVFGSMRPILYFLEWLLSRVGLGASGLAVFRGVLRFFNRLGGLLRRYRPSLLVIPHIAQLFFEPNLFFFTKWR